MNNQETEQYHKPLDRLSLELPGTDASAGSSSGKPSEHQADNTSSPEPPRPRKKHRILRFLLLMFFVCTLLGCGSVAAVYMWASNDLPSFSKIADYRPPLVTNVLARDGSLIGQFYRERRFLVTQEEMTPWLPKAFLAIEDDEFYSHPGIDLKAIVRAMLTNLKSGQKTSGGSTITQQVVKRLMLTPEKSYERKIKEIILAYRLEQQLSKDEILTLYLNQIFLGNNSYGVEAAARTYFAKHAKDLTLAESALLASLPQAPSTYNPYRHPEAAQTRQKQVLRRMRDLGWIDDGQYDKAIYEKLEYKSMPSGMGREGGWYLEEVRRELIELFNEENSRRYGFDFGLYGEDVVYEMGLTVRTSMDPVQQMAADEALRHGLEDATKRHGWRGPIEKLTPPQFDKFLNEQEFAPNKLENNAWVKALVTTVTQKNAELSLGSGYTGPLALRDMGWPRNPNKHAAGSVTAVLVTDARKVLEPGDVVWVSLSAPAPAKGKEAFSLGAVTTKTPIPLKLQQYPDIQGAMVSIEPESGDVVAMVGGYAFGYEGSQFNRATQAMRQPGSSFKPILYSAALDHGFTAGSIILDAPILLINEMSNEPWRPRNFEGGFEGPMRLNRALARSRNLCSIRVAQSIGVQAMLDRAWALGLPESLPPVLALSLGAGEVSPLAMTRAYTAFANGGKLVKPRMIQSIQGSWGNTIYENQPEYMQALSPQNAYIMACLLKGVVQYGTATRANVFNRPLGAKTGTTNGETDAWFLAITPHLVTGTYIGYDQVQPMGRGETGTGAALPIYVYYGKKALEAYPPDDFTMPPGIVTFNVEGITLPFMAGTAPDAGTTVVPKGGSHPAQRGDDLLKELF